MRCSKGSITFNKADHPSMVAEPGRYPLVINPMIGNVCLGNVLVDGGTCLNILFGNTLRRLVYALWI